MRNQAQRQVSRAKAPPPGLAELIKTANLVTAHCEMPDLISDVAAKFTTLDRAVARFRCSIQSHYPMSRFREFRRFIGPIRHDTWVAASEKYGFVRSAREVLRAIAEGSETRGTLALPPIGDAHLASMVTDSEGRIKFLLGGVLKMLDGVEAVRIRKCPVCDAIFWAGRIDKPACSSRCGHILRTRNWRQSYVQRYKLQRYKRSESSGDCAQQSAHQ